MTCEENRRIRKNIIETYLEQRNLEAQKHAILKSYSCLTMNSTVLSDKLHHPMGGSQTTRTAKASWSVILVECSKLHLDWSLVQNDKNTSDWSPNLIRQRDVAQVNQIHFQTTN